MEKDQNIDNKTENIEIKEPINKENDNGSDQASKQEEVEIKEISPEEKIKELEDKVTRTFAEMENQRRRFEKEREDAFNYGGYAFAKETLNLIDNLERSKLILENDEVLKNSEALKKNFRSL